MAKIILPSGLPGCGKSTWAKDHVAITPNVVRVCRDDIRFMLGFGWGFNKDNEKIVKEIRDDLIAKYLKLDKDVIVDELNLGEKNINYFKQKFPGVEFWVKTFDTDVNECIRRDANREYTVGKKRILEMWRKIEPEYKPIEFVPSLESAIIVDLDGTFSLFYNKNPYIRDFENDQINDRINYILNSIGNVARVLFVSGRSDKFTSQTLDFMWKHGVSFSQLFMRKEGDNRSDVIVKDEIYQRHIKDKYNVLFVFDDRLQMVRYWVSQGLYVFNCNQHMVEF